MLRPRCGLDADEPIESGIGASPPPMETCMKFGQPLLSTKLSGKLGGVVGASARGGVGYFRRRVDGSNPQTPAQALVRAIMSALSNNWQTVLTAGQRASWASKADPKESGIDVYVRGNFQQLLTGVAAAVATAPASVSLNDSPIGTPNTYDIGDEEWDITIPAGTNIQYALYITTPQSASRASRQYPFQLNQVVAPASSSITISAATGPLAGITAGQVFYARFVAFGSASTNLGRVGQEQIFRVECIA